MPNDNNRVTLRQVRMHSGQCDTLRIFDSFDLQIRPWTSEEIEEFAPIVTKLLTEIKHHTTKKEKDKEVWEVVVDMMNMSKEFLQDIRKIVYLTLKKSNETLHVKMGDKEQAMPFFTAEEYRSEIETPDIIKIGKVIFDQNYTKNLSTVSGLSQKLVVVDQSLVIPKTETPRTTVISTS